MKVQARKELKFLRACYVTGNFILYDAFGNQTEIRAGENTLAEYEYNANNGKLNKVIYGNGFSVEYEYNSLENVSEIWYTYGSGIREKAYSYEYTSFGPALYLYF